MTLPICAHELQFYCASYLLSLYYCKLKYLMGSSLSCSGVTPDPLHSGEVSLTDPNLSLSLINETPGDKLRSKVREIIKCQSVIRGFIARKNVRKLRVLHI